MLPVYSFRCQEFHGLERSHGAESCSECVTVILSVAVRFALALVCLDCGVYLVGRSDHFLLGLAGDPKMHNKALMPIPARRQFLGEAESMAGRAGIARR